MAAPWCQQTLVRAFSLVFCVLPPLCSLTVRVHRAQVYDVYSSSLGAHASLRAGRRRLALHEAFSVLELAQAASSPAALIAGLSRHRSHEGGGHDGGGGEHAKGGAEVAHSVRTPILAEVLPASSGGGGPGALQRGRSRAAGAVDKATVMGLLRLLRPHYPHAKLEVDTTCESARVPLLNKTPSVDPSTPSYFPSECPLMY